MILDEPTQQLDPIAAADFLATVGKINRELGVTVILTEHRLEEALPLASRAVVMDRGRILCEGPPASVGESLAQAGARNVPGHACANADMGGRGQYNGLSGYSAGGPGVAVSKWR